MVSASTFRLLFVTLSVRSHQHIRVVSACCSTLEVAVALNECIGRAISINRKPSMRSYRHPLPSVSIVCMAFTMAAGPVMQ